MRKVATILATMLFWWCFTTAQEHDHSGHQEKNPVTSVRVQDDGNLPPPDSLAKARLEKTPRHTEFVDVKMEGAVLIRTFVVYPERKDKAPVVIVIHEIFGLSDWIRGVADQLAADGFIAIAPDLISGMGPGGGGTDSVKSRDEVTKLIRGLTPEEATKRLNAVRAYAVKLPAANGARFRKVRRFISSPPATDRRRPLVLPRSAELPARRPCARVARSHPWTAHSDGTVSRGSSDCRSRTGIRRCPSTFQRGMWNRAPA